MTDFSNEEVNWLRPSRVSLDPRRRAKVTFTRRKYRTGSRDSLHITIYKPLMKEMEWRAGDRVYVGLGVDKVFMRVCLDDEKDGFVLSPQTQAGEKTKDRYGKIVNSVAQVPLPSEHQFVQGDKFVFDDVVIHRGKSSDQPAVLVLQIGRDIHGK